MMQRIKASSALGRRCFCGLFLFSLLAFPAGNAFAVEGMSEVNSKQLVAEISLAKWYECDAEQSVDSSGQVKLIAHEEPAAKPQELKPQELRPIGLLGVQIGQPAGLTPRNRAIEDGVYDTPAGVVVTRTWPLITHNWTASKTKHRPLYFEEINAERYGYTRSRFFQPVLSTVHFFGTVPALPYLMTVQSPCECNYTLGHYRPGNCSPWQTHCWPRSGKGAGMEAAMVVGLIALIP